MIRVFQHNNAPDYDFHKVETPRTYYVLNILANCRKKKVAQTSNNFLVLKHMYIVQRDAQEESRNSYEHLIFADRAPRKGVYDITPNKREVSYCHERLPERRIESCFWQFVWSPSKNISYV